LSLLFLFYSSCWAFSWRRRDTHNVIHFLLLDRLSSSTATDSFSSSYFCWFFFCW
jgi:hypothetical protein